ncbi:MAG: ATPase [Betaproteobacteria bacterium]|nr:ATPase [Betaproteobacteria bacterium]MDE2622667.1 ATPase [Betaproteobacteria bacterium]
MKTTHVPSGFHPVQHERIIEELVHDSYKLRGKLPEPTVCPSCGAVFRQGRWQWLETVPGANEHVCPACLRIQDHFPAGYVFISGGFASSHQNELLQIIHNEEAHQKAEHPLKRIMAIKSEEGGVLVTTTDIHLARGIGEALHRAYQGTLTFHYNPEQFLLRVRWDRD